MSGEDDLCCCGGVVTGIERKRYHVQFVRAMRVLRQDGRIERKMILKVNVRFAGDVNESENDHDLKWIVSVLESMPRSMICWKS